MLKKPSFIEKAAGDPGVEVGTQLMTSGLTTALSTTPFAGLTPIIGLFPLLWKIPAAKRQQERFEQAFSLIEATLAAHQEKLEKLSDGQYNLLNEAIAATFQAQTTQKLAYLRNAVEKSLSIEILESQEVAALSRMVRDISAQEADFVLKHYGRSYVHVTNVINQDGPDVMRIRTDSPEALIVDGLESIGVLIFGLGTMGDGDMLKFSPLTAKLVFLLRPST